MRVDKRVLIMAVALLGAAGCERAQRKEMVLAPAPVPATRPAPPATRPAAATQATRTTQPADGTAAVAAAPAKPASFMQINGTWHEFPEAKLILRKEGERMVAVLTSNDPPEVLKPGYHGNRYYFELRFDRVIEEAELSQAQFHYRAASASPADSPNGIFLDGDRVHYQPFDMQVFFGKDGAQVVAEIGGEFLFFPKGQVVGQSLQVQAALPAKVERK